MYINLSIKKVNMNLKITSLISHHLQESINGQNINIMNSTKTKLPTWAVEHMNTY